jgi:UDP-glucuronate 4-epimerase
MPYSEHHCVSHPLQLYAATKRSNELMAHSYSHLFRLPTTGLRFFTVYGPWGRPDMAPMKFAKAIFAGETIDLYNNGDHSRDFTYIDDIVDGIVAASDHIAEPNPDWSGDAPDPASSNAPYRIYNIGNATPVQLLDFIAALEGAIGRKAIRRMLPAQPGDTHATWADISGLQSAVGYTPKVPVGEGVARFVEWYRTYFSADLAIEKAVT